jgi:hypothetical protein
LKLTSNRGGGKPPTSFLLCNLHKFSTGRYRSRWPELPLYHTAHKKSIGKLHKLTPDLFPEFVQLFLKKTIDFSVGLWYTIREVKGRGNNPPRKKIEKISKKPLTNHSKYAII